MSRFKAVFALVCATCLLTGLARPTHAATGDARVRLVHAIPGAPAVQLYVDTTSLVANATYFSASDYQNITPGTRNFRLFPNGTGASGTPLASLSQSVATNGTFTIVAYGKPSGTPAPTLLAFADDTTTPATGKARVRFIHASPDAPAVDIAVTGGNTLFTNVASGTSGGYIEVAAGTYGLEVRPTGTTNVALSVPGVSFAAGKVYTVYAAGLLAGTGALALTAQISIDNLAAAATPAPTIPATTVTNGTPTTPPTSAPTAVATATSTAFVDATATALAGQTSTPASTVDPPAPTPAVPGFPDTGTGGTAAMRPDTDGIGFGFLFAVIIASMALVLFAAVRARNSRL